MSAFAGGWRPHPQEMDKLMRGAVIFSAGGRKRSDILLGELSADMLVESYESYGNWLVIEGTSHPNSSIQYAKNKI